MVSFYNDYSGTYVGNEPQFYGRPGHLVLTSGTLEDGIFMAQFNEGKLWETHSRLNFATEEWLLDGHYWLDCGPVDSEKVTVHLGLVRDEEDKVIGTVRDMETRLTERGPF